MDGMVYEAIMRTCEQREFSVRVNELLMKALGMGGEASVEHRLCVIEQRLEKLEGAHLKPVKKPMLVKASELVYEPMEG